MNVNIKRIVFRVRGSSIFRHIILFGVLCFFIAASVAQIRPRQLRNQILQSSNPVTKPTPQKATQKAKSIKASKQGSLAPIVNPLDNKKATLVFLEHSETMMVDEIMHPDIQVIKGNVRFRHNNALLYCDSAYFYKNANSFDAFSNVRIVQGDTLFVYGDFLFYDGNQRLARLRQNVKMVNRNTTLTTDSLNYNRSTNFAYYYTGGKIVDAENTLTSVWGQYSTSTNQALFKNAVNLTNANFILTADSLRYNTKSNVANIISPTHIIYDKETNIDSKNGWYNTRTEQMMLLDRSVITQKDGKVIIGDTVFYDKIKKYGEVFSKVILNDTVQKTTLYGNYLYYNENTEVGIAADSALLVDWSSKDTMYMHADTLFTAKDSIYDVSRGYYNVRFFRNDVQGICDSLIYSTRDSVMHMFGEPVLWNEKNQLSGDFIKIITKNQKVESINVENNAIVVQREDSLYFNQISGKQIVALVDSGALRKVDVSGNAETIYFPRDEKDSTIIGVNKTESSYVILHFKDRKVERIVLTAASSGTMYPIDQLSGGDLLLKNFFWLENQRPKDEIDVLKTYPKTPRNSSDVVNKSVSNTESKDLKK
ncbi:MAG: OstA-like protein, partial [Paludibacter sp.]|nr:OstA-like protein [Paludibacter sp.]